MPIEVIGMTFGMLFVIGGIILAGQHLRLRHEERRSGMPDAEGLRASIEGLQEEVQALRDELTGMDERLDFTERLLTQPPAEGTESR